MPPFDIRRVSIQVVKDLCERFHGYKSSGNVAVYAWAVFELEKPVAAFAWQPPPPGAAKSVSPYGPQGVLALSRMVAVPKAERALKHISKPLIWQMKKGIDRSRWPALVTYSDENQGHTGYVYQCSGWTPTTKRLVPTYSDGEGARVSAYSSGVFHTGGLIEGAPTYIQRWEHWACPPWAVPGWMAMHGWTRVETKEKWASGNPAHTWVRRPPLPAELRRRENGQQIAIP